MQQKEKTMNNNINIYDIETVVKVSEMFAENNMTLRSLFMENTKNKFIKKVLDLHDLFELGVTAVVWSKDEKASKTQWYELKDWNAKNFEHWALVSEMIHYK